MNNPNSPSGAASARATLKLKIGARKTPRESKAPPVARPQSKTQHKPDAHWSDEYKRQMQEDMDALASR
jgi:hypothetical protein